ncbi:transporter [Acinetobacter johnsonii]|uniref:Transporter n=1 Tax=Acinetobacter johnsonii TaxID=40214 RepID=A0A3R9EXS0_ACIJO|nr:transporter [Acinetobacter johnsonii]KUG39527.1 transporter [Acinetobacter johnsonii]MDH1364231.1 transporter [Acinetobacter johnsonii]MDH1437737.1 transporter [Acinetobacter johnsonii]MDH1517443.1 transporter [Acinetobacter johnsonii]RSE21469.1 transporter [Acinetobacter johnsonii]
MKLKTLTTAMILATVPMTGAFAAALDRSGQSISAFLQPGNYFEAGISVLDPSVSGKVRNGYSPSAAPPSAIGLQNTNLSDMGDDYYFPSAALKLQVTDHFSFGLLYDQPFGADATYSLSDTVSAAAGGVGLFHNGTETTEVEVKSQSISMIFGYQPTENFNFYAGPVYQTIEGDVQLRGLAYGATQALGMYNANIKEDSAVGWLAGFAYQIPEIALKTSITYRSEIDHKASAREYGQSNVLAFVGSSPVYDVATDANITTPQSVNLDFQTGIMANTVAFANVRWVNWKDFSLDLKQFGTVADTLGALGQTPDNPNGFDIVGYTDDQWSANVGVGRKFNDLWAGNVSVGWDSGAGNPISTLGPTEGYWNVGLGLQYSPTPATFIAGGVKYFWLGDAKAQAASNFGSDTYVAEFNDNDALAYGLKIGYKF